MKISNCQQVFGAFDKTSRAMTSAVEEWFRLYYAGDARNGEDPCQRIAYTVVSKLVRTVFAEYGVSAGSDFVRQVLDALGEKKKTALQQALVGGECYLKPWTDGSGFRFTVIPRDHILIFGRDPEGQPTDVGTMERSVYAGGYYTLLERRTLGADGRLTLENKLYRASDPELLGSLVSLHSHPEYAKLPRKYTFETPLGSVGLVRLATPMLNCVDGSNDGVSVYAAAVGLIHAIDRNEAQLAGEFDRGQSRVFASNDLLQDGQLSHDLFVGLDEDPERVGLTVFAPQLRHEAFLERKREYLRNIESVIGLKRGMLSDANSLQRTATEIAAGEAELNLTVMDFQQMWEDGLRRAVSLCAALGQIYGVPGAAAEDFSVDWGNGVLYDEDKLWQDYKEMVQLGLIAPEVALGWRFGMPADTEQQREAIREKFLNAKCKVQNAK